MAAPILFTTLVALATLTSSLSPRPRFPTLRPRSIVPPDGCPIPTWTVSTFKWFNGSNSLDCIHNPTDIATKGCLCAGTGGWCDPNLPCNGSIVPVCVTGLPNYTPWGFGPPETLDIDFADGLQCHDEFVSFRVKDIGNGECSCGYADRGMGRIISFYGSTNYNKSLGHIDYILGNGHALTCNNGSKITYSGSVDFPFSCVHDAYFNATCTAPTFEIPVLSYSWVS